MGRQELKSVLLDTHAWAWSLTGDARLSNGAERLLEQAEAVFVSPISFYEIGQKVRGGKWPEMEPFLDRLTDLVEEQGGRVAALVPEICLRAATMAWGHRDPFDRILAATASYHGLPLISADAAFDDLMGHQGWIARLW